MLEPNATRAARLAPRCSMYLELLLSATARCLKVGHVPRLSWYTAELMYGRREWRVRTPFREIRLRIVGISTAPASSQASTAELLSELSFELRNYNPEVFQTLREVQRAVSGLGVAGFSAQASHSPRVHAELERDLRRAVASGRLEIAEVQRSKTLPGRRALVAQAPALGPEPDQAEEDGHFEVHFVDETGQPIDGIEVVFSTAGLTERKTTDASGKATFDATASFASVNVASTEAVRQVLEPRWQNFRVPKLAAGPNVTHVVFAELLESAELESDTPHTVVIKPRFGKIHLALFDKAGRTRHALKPYQIDGPMTLAGMTDDQGQLLHEDVPFGDYVLTLQDPDNGALVSPAVVVDPATSEPQVRYLGVLPHVELARLNGLFFDTNKSFLLPAVLGVFDRLRQVYVNESPSELLLVGHADTTAGPAINDPLSLERANNTAAFLKDDVDAWLDMYDVSIPVARRWGSTEDQHMLAALPDIGTRLPNESAVHWFQRTRKLKVDGSAGPETRRGLITEYMALDGTTLSSDEFDIQITTHGAGENFPLDDTGQNLDVAPPDNKSDAIDRRVELFFFDPEFGIQPAPPGQVSPAGSTQYPTWRNNAQLAFDSDGNDDHSIKVRLLSSFGDALPHAPYEIVLNGAVRKGIADADGWLFESNVDLPTTAHLRWGPADLQPSADVPDPLVFESDVRLGLPEEDPGQDLELHLANLAYSDFDSLDVAKKRFQHNFNAPEGITGSDDDVRATLRAWLAGTNPPRISEQDAMHIATGGQDFDYVPIKEA